MSRNQGPSSTVASTSNSTDHNTLALAHTSTTPPEHISSAASSSSEGGGVLALSDIMHTQAMSMSPSPGPTHEKEPRQLMEKGMVSGSVSDDDTGHPGSTSNLEDTPKSRKKDKRTDKPAAETEEEYEPVTEEEVSGFRKSLVEMGFALDGQPRVEISDSSSREELLLDMVLKLTRAPLPNPTQVLEQAALIANYQTQLARMAQEIENERLLWDVERYGWERTAEVLISQKSKAAAAAGNPEELERRISVVASENQILRDRLQQVNERNAALEAEVAKLKPILLMVPPAHLSQSNGKGKRRRNATSNSNDDPDARDAESPIPSSSQSQQPRTIVTERAAAAAAAAAAADTAPPAPPPPKTDFGAMYRYPYPYYPGGQGPVPSTSAGTKSTNPYLSYAISTRMNGGTSQTHQATASTSFSGFNTTWFDSANVAVGGSHMHTVNHASGSGSRLGKNAIAPNAGTLGAGANQQKARKSSSGTLSYDARTEHLLLAARKIGRERALALYARQAEKEREKYVKEREATRLKDQEAQVERNTESGAKSGKARGSAYYRNTGGAGGAGGPEAVNRTEERERALQRVVEQHEEHRRLQGHAQGQGKKTLPFVFETPGQTARTAAASSVIKGVGRIIAHADELRGQASGSVVAGVRIVGEKQSQAQPQQQGSSYSYQHPTSSSTTSTLGVPGGARIVGLPQTPQPHRSHALPSSSSQTQAAQQQSQTQRQPGPAVPNSLDSLLSAARSMMSDDEAEEREREGSVLPVPGGNDGQTPRATAKGSRGGGAGAAFDGVGGVGRRRGAAAMDEPESPIPKRRRTASGANAAGAPASGMPNGHVVPTTSSRRAVGGKSARVPSALDVLADQAQLQVAAAATTTQSSTDASETLSINPASPKASAHVDDDAHGMQDHVHMGTVSNARAEVVSNMVEVNGNEGVGKRKSGRGKGGANAAPKGGKAKVNEKGKGKAVLKHVDAMGDEVEESDLPVTPAPLNDRISDPALDHAGELAPVESAPPPPASTANPPERRRRGRPRKDHAQSSTSIVGARASATPAAADGGTLTSSGSGKEGTKGRNLKDLEVVPAAGVSLSASGRRRGGSRGRAMVGPSSSGSGRGGDKKSERSVSGAREPTAGVRKRAGKAAKNIVEPTAPPLTDQGEAVEGIRLEDSRTQETRKTLESDNDPDHPVTHEPQVNVGAQEQPSANFDSPQNLDVVMGDVGGGGPKSSPSVAEPIELEPQEDPSISQLSAPDDPLPSKETTASANEDQYALKALPTPPNDLPDIEREGITTMEDAGHDSELDADAEADPDHDAEEDADAEADDDEDLDAEGEDEDEREADGSMPSSWSHVAFSSTDISALMQKNGGMAVEVEDDEMDAEGEIVENELDEPTAAIAVFPPESWLHG